MAGPIGLSGGENKRNIVFLTYVYVYAYPEG